MTYPKRTDEHCKDDIAWQEFCDQYRDKPRSYGDMSDFELANAVFMADRNDLNLIVVQTAAKERIRWLSIELAKALKATLWLFGENEMLKRLGRGKAPIIGKYVVVEYKTWEGPERPGSKGRVRVNRRVFPINQWAIAKHPRHPSGYDPETGKHVACVAPSCNFYSELCRYAGFRWSASHG